MGVRLVKYGVNNGTGTYNHDEMENRDLPDQHPISAITGLDDRLNDIEILIEESAVIDETIDTPSLSLVYDKDGKTLTGNVKIFESEDNALVEKTSGLYVDKYLDIETQDTETVHLTVEGKGETLKTMYDTGTRFSHNGTWTNIAIDSEANAWYYDEALDSFVQPQNTTSYTGFVSTVQYRTYTHRATLKSTNSDNDGIGVIVAYAIDESGKPHTLSLVINKGGESHVGSYYYALIYDKGLPDQQILFTKGNKTGGTIPGNHSTSGWSGSTITIEINKAGASITCAASNYNSTVINYNTLIEINLDDYSWGSLFRGKVQYGYCAQSQPLSYFQNIYFTGKGPLKANVILSQEEGNIVQTRDDGIYSSVDIILSKEEGNLLKNINGNLYLSDKVLSEGGSSGGEVFITKLFEEDLEVGNLVCYNPTLNIFEKAIYDGGYKSNVLGIIKSILDDYMYIQIGGVYFTDYFEINSIPTLTKLYLSSTDLGKFTTEVGKTYIGYVIDGGFSIDIQYPIKYQDLTQYEIQNILDQCFN